MLLEHSVRAAASLTFWTAGNKRPIRIAIIAITTNSSMSVKPFPARGRARPARRTGSDEPELAGVITDNTGHLQRGEVRSIPSRAKTPRIRGNGANGIERVV